MVVDWSRGVGLEDLGVGLVERRRSAMDSRRAIEVGVGGGGGGVGGVSVGGSRVVVSGMDGGMEGGGTGGGGRGRRG